MHNSLDKPVLLLWLSWFGTIVVLGFAEDPGLPVAAFLLMAAVAQATLLCLPLLLLRGLLHIPRLPRPLNVTLCGLGHLYTAGGILLLLANYKIHAMYGFYINGFIVNLLVTPGGIEALGLSHSFFVSATLGLLAFAGLYYLLLKGLPAGKSWMQKVANPKILSAITAIFLVQASWYALAEYRSYPQILQASSRVAWYIPVTAKSLWSKLGIEYRRGTTVSSPGHLAGTLDYPYHDTVPGKLARPLNIVWLTVESWRSDMLNETIMPNTYQWASKNSRFNSHYSGGNGTRMGVFTQFYGLYGDYWFEVLRQRKSPVLIDTLMANGYQAKAFTSAHFSYPEFDKTVFAKFRADQLHEYSQGPGWSRDQKNVTDLTDYIRTAKDPFFAFMFFESPHANYSFPENDVLKTDYLKDFDYLTTDIEGHIDQIKNRYINSCHYLDTQLKRVFDVLESSGRLEDTIVVLTGDHGEEFMEKGYWGHNSTFAEEQVRVPLVLHIPGREPREVEALTSHLDLPATILSALGAGATVSSKNFGFGQDLYANAYKRTYAIVSDWHGSALVTDEIKYVFSGKALQNTQNGEPLMTQEDGPLLLDRAPSNTTALLSDYLRKFSRYYVGSANQVPRS